MYYSVPVINQIVLFSEGQVSQNLSELGIEPLFVCEK